jgi:hypothetical protein
MDGDRMTKQVAFYCVMVIGITLNVIVWRRVIKKIRERFEWEKRKEEKWQP